MNKSRHYLSSITSVWGKKKNITLKKYNIDGLIAYFYIYLPFFNVIEK